LAEKKSLNFIIDQWAIHVWKKENPQNKDHRFDAFDRLFRTIQDHKYAFDDIHDSTKRYIKTHTVPKKGPKDKIEAWNKAADIHIEHAIAKVFGPQVEIAVSNNEKLPNAVPKSQPIEEQTIQSKVREHVPNEKVLEYIEKNFKFEGDDSDLE
jgi:hypothetical protein